MHMCGTSLFPFIYTQINHLLFRWVATSQFTWFIISHFNLLYMQKDNATRNPQRNNNGGVKERKQRKKPTLQLQEPRSVKGSHVQERSNWTAAWWQPCYNLRYGADGTPFKSWWKKQTPGMASKPTIWSHDDADKMMKTIPYMAVSCMAGHTCSWHYVEHCNGCQCHSVGVVCPLLAMTLWWKNDMKLIIPHVLAGC